jgi:hypothetical protein
MSDFWAFWEDWRDQFAAMLDPRFYTVEWLDGEVFSGRIHLIAVEDAAVLVTLKGYPTGATEVHGMAAAGNMVRIVNTLIPAAERWGREHGAIVASIESREGWGRVLKPYGYEPHQLTIRKEL